MSKAIICIIVQASNIAFNPDHSLFLTIIVTIFSFVVDITF